MKRTYLAVLITLMVLAGVCGNAYAYRGYLSPPHTNYTPKYGSSCGTTAAACHDYGSGTRTFLPTILTSDPANDYTRFCLSCHNASGEAHDLSAGAPSTNVYTNYTTFNMNGSYKGTSHSWTGTIKNAGTRVPTASGFEGTLHMVGGTKVACQTCHEGMGKPPTYVGQEVEWANTVDQGDHKNYVLDKIGGSTAVTIPTAQYLNQYLRVYKNTTSTTLADPTNSRTKKTKYLVSPDQYTYDYTTGKITFATSQGNKPIYADIHVPYLRIGDATNAMCLDCHNDRIDSSVSHAPGTGVKDNHPVSLNYGYSSGLNNTLKSSADSNIYTEGGKVYCTSCHDPHNAASNDGAILRAADASSLCTDCHKVNGFDGYTGSMALLANHNGSKHSSPTVCVDCHTPHGSNNIMLIKNVINGKTITFRNFSNANSFGNDNGSSICEACHTNTAHHLASNAAGGQGHNTGKNCVSCHKHSTGFGGGGCTACHGFPPDTSANPVAPTGWADTSGNLHSSHMTHLAGAPYNLSGTAFCGACHGGTIPRGDHNTGKNTAGIDLSAWGGTFNNGGTVGTTDTSDDTCANVSCHGGGTRTWGASCTSCHGQPPATGTPVPSGWTDTGSGDAHNRHIGYLTAAPYNLTSYNLCNPCHGNGSGTRGNHNTGLDGASIIDTTSWGGGTFSINGTAKVTADDTCSNVSCHFTTGTRTWGATPEGSTVACDQCHEYPGSVTQDWAGTNGHMVRYNTASISKTHMTLASNFNKLTDTYISVTGDTDKCGKCHANVPSNHRNGAVNVGAGGGLAACGGGEFTISVTASRSNVTCSNAKCHAANKTTPNWY